MQKKERKRTPIYSHFHPLFNATSSPVSGISIHVPSNANALAPTPVPNHVNKEEEEVREKEEEEVEDEVKEEDVEECPDRIACSRSLQRVSKQFRYVQ